MGGEIKYGKIDLHSINKETWATTRIPIPISFQSPFNSYLINIEFDLSQYHDKNICILTYDIPNHFEKIYINGELTNLSTEFNYQGFNLTFLFKNILIWGLFIFLIHSFVTLVKRFDAKFFVIFIAFFRLLIEFFVKTPFSGAINGQPASLWINNYQDMGFMRRALFGSLIRIFDVWLPEEEIKYLAIFLFLIVFITILYFLYHEIKASSNDDISFLACVYVCSPFFVLYYFNNWLIPLMDYALLGILILCLIVLKQKKYLLVLIFSIVGMLIHEMFIFFIYPALFSILFYFYASYKNKIALFYSLIIFLLSVLLLVAFQVNTIPFNDFNDLLSYLKTRTNLDVNYWYSVYYFTSKYTANHTDYIDIIKLNLPTKSIISYIVLSPVLYIYYKILLLSFKSELKRNKRIFISYILFSLLPATAFLGYLTASDYGRWLVMSLSMSFFMLLFLCSRERSFIIGFAKSSKYLSSKFGRNWYLYICLYLIIIGFGTTASLNLSDKIVNFINFL